VKLYCDSIKSISYHPVAGGIAVLALDKDTAFGGEIILIDTSIMVLIGVTLVNSVLLTGESIIYIILHLKPTLQGTLAFKCVLIQRDLGIAHRSGPNMVKVVVTIIVESALLFCASMIALLVSAIAESTVQIIFADIVSKIYFLFDLNNFLKAGSLCL
jgi:hypothetical protein